MKHFKLIFRYICYVMHNCTKQKSYYTLKKKYETTKNHQTSYQ